MHSAVNSDDAKLAIASTALVVSSTVIGAACGRGETSGTGKTRTALTAASMNIGVMARER